MYVLRKAVSATFGVVNVAVVAIILVFSYYFQWIFWTMVVIHAIVMNSKYSNIGIYISARLPVIYVRVA